MRKNPQDEYLTSNVKEAYAYGGVGRRTSEARDPEGLNLTTSFAYDSEGRLTRTTRPVDKDSDGNTIQKLVCEDEALIDPWDYKFDSVGRMDEGQQSVHGTKSILNFYERTKFMDNNNENKVLRAHNKDNPKNVPTTISKMRIVFISLIAILLCVLLLRLLTGWHIIDIFRGKMEVEKLECNRSKQQFLFTQHIDIHEVGYCWMLWYRENKNQQWRVIDLFAHDSTRLYQRDVAMAYDYDCDILTIIAKRVTTNITYGPGTVKYYFDKTNRGVVIKREFTDHGYSQEYWDGKNWTANRVSGSP